MKMLIFCFLTIEIVHMFSLNKKFSLVTDENLERLRNDIVDQGKNYLESIIYKDLHATDYSSKPEFIDRINDRKKCKHQQKKDNKIYYSSQSKNARKNSQAYIETGYEKLRMHFDFTYTLPHEQKILEEILIPPVKSFFESTLKVKRIPGRLRFPSGMERCSHIPIPKNLIEEGEEVDTIVVVTTYRGMAKYERDMKESMKANKRFEGISLEDTLNVTELIKNEVNDTMSDPYNLFIREKYISSKILNETADQDEPPSGIFGWATYCSQDSSTLRPTTAVIQFVSDISLNPTDFEEAVWTTIHELTHALGFDLSLFTDFVNDKYFRIPLNETLVIKTKLLYLQDLITYLQSNNLNNFSFDFGSILSNITSSTEHPSNKTSVQYLFDKDTTNVLYITKMDIKENIFQLITSIELDPEGKNLTSRYFFNKINLPETSNYTYIEFDNSIDFGLLEYFIENFADNTRVFIKSKNVLKLSKLHYDCDSADGMELEHMGGPGTSFSHWSKRTFNTDYMIGNSNGEYFVSKITLALLHDSGWYSVDYEKGDDIPWGFKKGCEFIENKCVYGEDKSIKVNNEASKNENQIKEIANPHIHSQESQNKISKLSINIKMTSDFEEFCSSPSEEKCSIGRKYRGNCSLIQSSQPFPKSFQYIENNPFIGANASLGDHCPIPNEWFDLHYDSLGSC